METMSGNHADRASLQFAMQLSLWIGIFMFFTKAGAYLLTGSAAILSDAAESVVHVVAVCFATYSLRLSYRPADPGHLYGHTKISFFSAGFEGAMIIVAALYIIYSAIAKWLVGLSLQNLGLGTGLTALATLLNGGLGFYLRSLGRRKKSLILEANGAHVLTDCWTSLGVLIALGLTITTGWLPWDPIFAILIAFNILLSGARLVSRSVGGLMDTADPQVHEQLTAILDRETRERDIGYHHLLHRNVGYAHRVEVHLLFPKNTPVGDAHKAATSIEKTISESLDPTAFVTTHLEAIEDHGEAHQHDGHGPP